MKRVYFVILLVSVVLAISAVTASAQALEPQKPANGSHPAVQTVGHSPEGSGRQYFLNANPSRITSHEEFWLGWYCRGLGEGPATEAVINVPAGIVIPGKCDGSSSCQIVDTSLSCYYTGTQSTGVSGSAKGPGNYTFTGSIKETVTGNTYPISATLQVDGGHSGVFAQVLDMSRESTVLQLSGTETRVYPDIKFRYQPLILHESVYLKPIEWDVLTWKGPNYGLNYIMDYVEIRRALLGPSTGEAFTRAAWNWYSQPGVSDCRAHGAVFRLYSTPTENTVSIGRVQSSSATVSFDNGFTWDPFYQDPDYRIEHVYTTTKRSGTVLIRDTSEWAGEVDCGSLIWDVEGLYQPLVDKLTLITPLGNELMITAHNLPVEPQDAWVAFRTGSLAQAVAPVKNWKVDENHRGSFTVDVPEGLTPGMTYGLLFGYWWKGGYVVANNALYYKATQTYRTFLPSVQQ